MRTVQMPLDDDLVRSVDRVSRKHRVSRSAFTRDALREALARYAALQQEKKHRAGYQRYPVTADEFAVWEEEQDWSDP